MTTSDLETGGRLSALDDGVFEQLVVRYLVGTYPELHGIAVTGINEEGKPVPCPVDGIYFLPGPPPVCVFIASTTMARKALRGKWLGEEGDVGDVPKALAEFESWRQSIPDVSGKLFLATNRMLAGDSALYRDAIATATNAGLRTEIVEASALIRYLDHTPEGQMARAELLGVPASRVSRPLLRMLSERSLSLYWDRHGPSIQTSLVERSAFQNLKRLLEIPGGPVAVVGPSGVGKTVLCCQLASHFVASGRLALWIPADEVILDAPLTTTLSSVLRKLRPSLTHSAGEDCLRVIEGSSAPLLLMVDDVNRAASPVRILESVKKWGVQAALSPGAVSPVRVLVPLWTADAALPTVHDHGRYAQHKAAEQEIAWRHTVVGSYSGKELAMLSKQRMKSEPPKSGPDPLTQIFDVFDGDPFLCGLIPSELSAAPLVSRAELIRHAFDSVIDQSCRQTVERARSLGLLTTASEVGGALDALIDLSLENDDPEPSYATVRARLGDRTADILHHLADTNMVGWIASESNQSCWHWKHNRLRDALIGRRLAVRAFHGWDSTGDFPVEVGSLLRHPGLSEAWALALVFAPGTSAQVRLIERLGIDLPVALTHALRLRLFPSERPQRDSLRNAVQGLLANLTDRKNEYVESLETLTLKQLIQTEDSLVLEITEGLVPAFDVDLARTYNGDTAAAVRVIAGQIPRLGFVPVANFEQLKTALTGCHSFHSATADRKEQLVSQVSARLQGAVDIPSVVALLGYLAWPEFAPLLADSWQRQRRLWDNPATGQEEEGRLLWLYHLWALGRCCTRETKALLVDLLGEVERLDDSQRVHGSTERIDHFIGPMRFGLRYAVTPPAAEAWVEAATQREDLAYDLMYVARQLEEPLVVEAYTRWAAVTQPHGWGDFTRSWDVLEEPQPIAQDNFRDAPVFESEAVLGRLWGMIVGPETCEVRRRAFDIWKRSAGVDALPLLQLIAENDPLIDDALAVRVRLRDRAAAPLLAWKIAENPKEWCAYAPRLYDDQEVRRAFLANFPAALAEGVDAGSAPRHIPSEYVAEFVRTHRTVLLKESRVWVSLLLTNEPEALTLFQEAISKASDEDLERLFFAHFSNAMPLTCRMLDTLVPVLDRLSASDVSDLLQRAIRDGHADWVVQHMSEFNLDEHRRRHWLTKEGILRCLETLSEKAREGLRAMITTWEFIQIVDHRGYLPALADRRAVLKEWVGSLPSDAKLTVAALMMAEQGTGYDVAWWQNMMAHAKESRSLCMDAYRLLQVRRWQS